MNNTKTFFDEQIALRWPDWEPTGPQVEDWESLIRPYRDEDVLEAIKEHACRRKYKSPSLSDVRILLKRYGFAKKLFTRYLFVQRPDNGVFHKIYIRDKQEISDEFLLEMGMYWAKKYKERYGGEWIAYTGVTDEDMCKKRWSIRSAK